MSTNSRHSLENLDGNSIVAPSSLNHTEDIAIGGIARTSRIILSTVGITHGALLRLFISLPAVADIELLFVNGTVTGSEVADRIETDGNAMKGLLTFCFDEPSATWNPILYTLPST